MPVESFVGLTPGDHQKVVAHKTVALGTELKLPVFVNKTGKKLRLTAAYWLPDTAVTGADTNNFAIGLINVGADGAGTTAMTAVTTFASGTDAAALVAAALAISATVANLDVANGEGVALSKTENGSGMALPAGLVVLLFRVIG